METSCAPSPLTFSLQPLYPSSSSHADIKVCSSWFHIQGVPLGQCLHHFGFLLPAVPSRLFFQPRTIPQPISLSRLLPLPLPLFLADLFTRGVATDSARWRRGIVLWFLASTAPSLLQGSPKNRLCSAELLKIRRLFINPGNEAATWDLFFKNS